MTYWEAALLGLIQGLTEFLPVSSSGHLELGKSLVGLNDMDLTFSILVHGATACSTVVVFRNEIFRLVRGIAHPDLKERTFSQRYIFWLAISTIPAVIVAFTLRDDIESVFLQHPHRVGWSLCATALVLFLSERIQSKKNTLSWKRSLGIGLAQAVAIIPGISRS
ncbi:MAG: undecaprenyl-diphosphate phosphatase, partial [Flavobacteriales bacterium]